jgi:serine protease inhibitor
MVVDRPFLFAITDPQTGLPLFLGRVTNPAGG